MTNIRNVLAIKNGTAISAEARNTFSSDYSIMEKAFDRFLIEKTELLQGVYDHCDPENKEYWEYRKSLIPVFCKYAKTLY